MCSFCTVVICEYATHAAVGIPTTELIQVVMGGTPRLQGTWAHRQNGFFKLQK
jgi:hypothetical protein